MDTRLGFVGIVVEDRTQASKVNSILGEYAAIIRGRIGVPDPMSDIGVIGLIIQGTNDMVGAMTGKLGNIKGVQVKSALASKPVGNKEELHHE